MGDNDGTYGKEQMKTNRVALIWNIVISTMAVMGTAFCAIRFAMAIENMALGGAVLYFILASLCIETSVFSIANLIKKGK